MTTAEGISDPPLTLVLLMTEEMKGTLVALTLIIEICTPAQKEVPLPIAVQLHLFPLAIDPLAPGELRHQRTKTPESYPVVLLYAIKTFLWMMLLALQQMQASSIDSLVLKSRIPPPHTTFVRGWNIQMMLAPQEGPLIRVQGRDSYRLGAQQNLTYVNLSLPEQSPVWTLAVSEKLKFNMMVWKTNTSALCLPIPVLSHLVFLLPCVSVMDREMKLDQAPCGLLSYHRSQKRLGRERFLE